MMPLFLWFLLIMNAFSFITFGYDKHLAKTKKRRVSEFNLLLLSLLGGSFGGVLGIYLFKHKYKKTSFLWRFYVVMFIQIALFLYFNFKSILFE